jgi:hypothetical protein
MIQSKPEDGFSNAQKTAASDFYGLPDEQFQALVASFVKGDLRLQKLFEATRQRFLRSGGSDVELTRGGK